MARITLPAMRLSVVVPCFNEEGNIARVVFQATEVGRTVAKELEIIVVDDGSQDGTVDVLRTLQQAIPELKVVRHVRNRGYGAAVRTGFGASRLDYVFLTDGDGQFDLTDLGAALPLLSRHDMVAGYRARRRDGWWRTLWGRMWTGLVNRTLGLRIRDANCAFKIIPQRLVRSVDLRSEGALISAELLFEARRFRMSIGQCAVRHYPRRVGQQSGASLRVVVVAFRELIAFATRQRSERAHATTRA